MVIKSILSKECETHLGSGPIREYFGKLITPGNQMLLVTIKTLDKMSKVYIMNTKIINQCCINVKYINTLSTDVFTILSNIMVRFAKIVTAPRELDTKIISILAKHSIIDVWQDPLYASAQHINLEIVFISIEYEIAYIFIYFFN